MKRLLILFFAFILLMNQNARGQEKKFHAVFIFNFYKQMEWPSGYKGGDFVIGVLGDSPIIPMLTAMSNTMSAGAYNKFVVKKFNSVAEITKCQMLFVPLEKSDVLGDVMKKVDGQSTLVMTEKAGLGGMGSAINFVTINNRLRFEMNESALKKASIQVSSMLKNLAILI